MQRLSKKFASGFTPTMYERNFIAFSLGVYFPSRWDTIVLCPQKYDRILLGIEYLF